MITYRRSGHRITWTRHPKDTAIPPTLWCAECGCGWRKSGPSRRELASRAAKHQRDTPGRAAEAPGKPATTTRRSGRR